MPLRICSSQCCCGVYLAYCGVWVCNVGVCLAIKQQICDLRCMCVSRGWHLRSLLHIKQAFSGIRWLKRTAYKWPTTRSKLEESVIIDQLCHEVSRCLPYLFIYFGYCFIYYSDLPVLRLRINKSITGQKTTQWSSWILKEDEINMSNGSLYGIKPNQWCLVMLQE